jgi:hypothetical protein
MLEQGEITPKRHFVHTSSSSLLEERSPCPAPAFLLLLRPNYRTRIFTQDDASCRTNPHGTPIILRLPPTSSAAPLACARSRVHNRRDRIYAAAGRGRVHSAALALVNCARSSRPFVRAHPLHLCTNQLCERSPVPGFYTPTLLALSLYLDTHLAPTRFSPDAHYAPPVNTHAPLGCMMSSSSTACPSDYVSFSLLLTRTRTRRAHRTCSGRRMRAGPVLLRDHGQYGSRQSSIFDAI